MSQIRTWLLFKASILALLSPLLNTGIVAAQASFWFQDTEVRAGTKRHFTVPVITGKDSSFIPVTVFNGTNDGKTLGITAGVHGYEYAPILAAQKLITSIDPAKLRGVVILVQVANRESFAGRTPFISPVDKKNLNRSFPGSADGTNTEKVAHLITEKIISKSDYFLDMHSGDAPEDLTAYSAYYSNAGMPQISSTGRKMAESMGFPYMVDFDTDGKDYMKKEAKSLYCSAEAFKRGIPSADIECGRLGIVEPAAVDKIESAVLGMLDYLEMQPWQGRRTVSKAKQISSRSYIRSEHEGIFYAEKKAGEIVKKGTRLGYVTNHFGEKLRDVVAESDGLLLMIIGTPPVNPGEDIAVIGKLD